MKGQLMLYSYLRLEKVGFVPMSAMADIQQSERQRKENQRWQQDIFRLIRGRVPDVLPRQDI